MLQKHPFLLFNVPTSTSAIYTSGAFITIRERNIDMCTASSTTSQSHRLCGGAFYGFNLSLDLFKKRTGQQVLEITMKEVTFSMISPDLITAKGTSLSNTKNKRKEMNSPPVSFHYIMKIGHIVMPVIGSISVS
jgi:hypothetical protein